MNSFKLGITLRNAIVVTHKPKPHPAFVRWFCKNEKDKKSDKPNQKEAKKHEKSEIVLNKLNSLLKDMIHEAPKDAGLKPLKLAKPTPKREKKVETKKASDEEVSKKDPILSTVKDVAESLGGDPKQTESELMKKLLNSEEGITSLSDIFKGMKIDRSQPQGEQQSRSQQVKTIMNLAQKHRERGSPDRKMRARPQGARKPQVLKMDNINLFGSEPLGIFTHDQSDYVEGVVNSTWNKLKERELSLAVTHPPANYFQQMILWTEQGKLWKFPIDNEQGMEEEQNVYFADHIFLEKHLESWCPQKGPIRHFMELVCVGLSKNPYLTVEAKIEHIEWYRNYFEDKRKLLKEVGAGLNEIEQSKKQISAE